MQLNTKYWYQVDGKYIRIGCIAKYKVKNTNSHVLAYRKAIQSSNDYRATSGISVAAAVIIAGVIGGTPSIVPPAGVVAAIITTIGVGAKSATAIYKAFAKMNLAKEEYDMAKVAGTKY